MFLAIRLAKAGYYNGNPDDVLNAPCDMVYSVLKYENEEHKYLECDRSINANR
jgi:hypothetical protein